MYKQSFQNDTMINNNAVKGNESFLYYASNLTAIEELPMEIRGRANMAIIEYGAGKGIKNPFVIVDGAEVDLRKYFRQIFDGIDTEKRRYENKMKINNTIQSLMRAYENNMSGLLQKSVEGSIKALKKLAVDCNKHDVTDIDEHIEAVLPKAYIDAENEKIPLPAQFEKFGRYMQEGFQKNYICEEERNQLRNIIGKIDAGYKNEKNKRRAR